MEMSGEFKIPAVKQQVWDALNNPEILKKALPGCEKLHMVSNTEFDSVVSTKLGPVRARFEAKVKLSDIEPPNSYKISIEGQGGPAGFASGTALVKLDENDNLTILTYSAEGSVGGKIAQIGSRLIDSAARKLADQFFNEFSKLVLSSETNSDTTTEIIEQKGIKDLSNEKSAVLNTHGISMRFWALILSVIMIIVILILTL